MVETQVCIVGGGVGGLWLSYTLSLQGYRTVLIDQRSIGKYASTRNQSWLHTGAFYKIMGGTSAAGGVAQMCKDSSRLLYSFCEKYCPEAIQKPQDALVVFDNEEARDSALKSVRDFGLPAESINRRLIEARENGFDAAKVPHGIIIQEGSFNSALIIRTLAIETARNGGQFLLTNAPTLEATYKYDGTRWIITTGEDEVRSTLLIFASGVKNPEFVSAIFSKRKLDAIVQRSIIALIPKITDRIIVVRESNMPGFTVFGPAGPYTSINLTFDSFDLEKFESSSAISIFRDHLTEKLIAYAAPMLSTPASFYFCDKLNNCNDPRNPFPLKRHGGRHYFWTDEGQSCFTFYPGKFIAAPLAAEHFVDNIKSVLGTPTFSPCVLLQQHLKIAKCPVMKSPIEIGFLGLGDRKLPRMADAEELF